MTESVSEAVGVIVAALKVERMLIGWAEKLEPEDRGRVKKELSGRRDAQALLDIWQDALEIADGERDKRS